MFARCCLIVSIYIQILQKNTVRHAENGAVDKNLVNDAVLW